jgi:hypothetical protein
MSEVIFYDYCGGDACAIVPITFRTSGKTWWCAFSGDDVARDRAIDRLEHEIIPGFWKLKAKKQGAPV